MDLSGALNWIKLSPKYLVAISVSMSIILFSPQDFVESIGLNEIRASYKPWLGAALVLSISLLAASTISSAYEYIKKKLVWRNNLKKVQSYLHNLTPEEADILKGYVGENTKTQYLPIESGVVQGLVNNKVIYQSANLGDLIDGWAYNVQPWAWDYLKNNLHLLFSHEEMARILRNDL